jgi:hypothetical protein
MLYIPHQPHQHHHSYKDSRPRVLDVPAVAEENSPVSPPTSTPVRHSQTAGHWTTFMV